MSGTLSAAIDTPFFAGRLARQGPASVFDHLDKFANKRQARHGRREALERQVTGARPQAIHDADWQFRRSIEATMRTKLIVFLVLAGAVLQAGPATAAELFRAGVVSCVSLSRSVTAMSVKRCVGGENSAKREMFGSCEGSYVANRVQVPFVVSAYVREMSKFLPGQQQAAEIRLSRPALPAQDLAPALGAQLQPARRRQRHGLPGVPHAVRHALLRGAHGGDARRQTQSTRHPVTATQPNRRGGPDLVSKVY